MGFWDFCRKIGKGIGTAIEGVGNFIGNEAVAGFGRSIRNACAEKVAVERSYEKQTASVRSTERLSEVLVSFSVGCLQQAETIENASIRAVENYYDALLKLLEQSSDMTGNQAGLKRLRASRTQIKRNIKGSIKNPLAKRMSLDDEECLRILKMEPGPEKGQAMSLFSQKIIESALSNTAHQVREVLDEQLEDINDYLSGIQEEQEREYKALRNQYDILAENGVKEQSDREKSCLDPAVTIAGISIAQELLQA